MLNRLEQPVQLRRYQEQGVVVIVRAPAATYTARVRSLILTSLVRGQLLKAMKQRGERAKAGEAGGGTDGRGARPSVNPTLSDLGVTRDQSHKWQKLKTAA